MRKRCPSLLTVEGAQTLSGIPARWRVNGHQLRSPADTKRPWGIARLLQVRTGLLGRLFLLGRALGRKRMGGVGRGLKLMRQMRDAAGNIEIDAQLWVPDDRVLLWVANRWTPWAFIRAILSVGFGLRSRPTRFLQLEGPGILSLGQSRWGGYLRSWFVNRDVIVGIGEQVG